MDPLLTFARGPLFCFCFLLMLLGLVRLGLLSAFDLVRAVRSAGDRNVPYRQIAKETVLGLIPSRGALAHGWTRILFHVGLIVVPLLLLDHILLWRGAFGISWTHMPKGVADVLTLITIAMGLVLLADRVFSRNARFMSGFMDYALLILLVLLFASGFIASRPYSPIAYKASMLVHVLCGNAVLALTPFTKLSHCLLYPLLRVSSNVAWRFPPRAGEAIAKALYGEEVRKV